MGNELIGVYRIVSPSGKAYVGMTMESFAARWNGHRKDLRYKRHKRKGLLRASIKYGIDELKFEVLESFIPGEISIEQVLQLEQSCWDKLATEGTKLYNGRPSGTGSVFHTEESKTKLRAATEAKLIQKYGNDFKRDSRGRALLPKDCPTCGSTFYAGRTQKYCKAECRPSRPAVNLGLRTIDEDEATRLFSNGLTFHEIAQHFGCSYNTACRAVKGRE